MRSSGESEILRKPVCLVTIYSFFDIWSESDSLAVKNNTMPDK